MVCPQGEQGQISTKPCPDGNQMVSFSLLRSRNFNAANLEARSRQEAVVGSRSLLRRFNPTLIFQMRAFPTVI
jgi:hypothetical protein